MTDTSVARSTESIRRRRVETGVPSLTAWERVIDRLRMRLPGKPSRTTIFGRAGLRNGKMYWMRNNPDLRASVIVKLARALRVRPSKFFEMLYRESAATQDGEILF